MPSRAFVGSLLLAAAALATACAHPAEPTVAPTQAAAWIDDPLVGAPPQEVQTLKALAQGDVRARQVRLDRLLDLLDAARFGQDEDARETLWSSMGGHPTGVGDRATREATERLLQEALRLADEAQAAASPPVVAYAADVITMLTTDLQVPGSAEDMSIRTLVYRSLADEGHPRVADNARWRLYDHVRGTLQGAIEVPAEQRMDVAVQALYARQDSVEPLLADTAPHARPPWPGADTLWGLVDAQREPLAEHERWAEVLEHRAGEDHELHDTLKTVLPAERREDWPLAEVAQGTGRPESLAPVLWVQSGRMTVDAGRSHTRQLALDADIQELSQAVGNLLAQDGRGTLLLVADPAMPAPQVQTTLRTIFRAHAERVEIGVHEARLEKGAPPVVTALPMYVTHRGGQRAGDRAWAQTRLHVHLDGRGASAAVDGAWLSDRPVDGAGFDALATKLSAAYPRERGLSLSLGSDIQLRQLIDLLAALHGDASKRRFAAVGWFADGWRPDGGGKGGDSTLERRLAMAWPEPPVEIEQPYPLEATDQKRLEGFGADLAVCLPELEAKRAPEAVALRLRFEEGRLRETTVEGGGNKLPKKGVAALVDCVEEEGYALRLRGHREGLEVVVTLGRGG